MIHALPASQRLAPFRDLALWFAADPIRYRIPAYGLLFALAALAIAGALSKKWEAKLAARAAGAGYVVLALLAVFAGRWPTLFVKDTLNEDEAQALAQAITALHVPTPWLGFDGGTHGPLNTYALDIPAIFGFTLTFFTARVIALLLIGGTLACLYVALTQGFSARIARLGVIAPTAFFGLAQEAHYLHYSGETLSIFLMSAGIVCVAWIARSSRPELAGLAAGAIAGAMPFAKLQGSLLGVAIGALAIFTMLMRLGVSRSTLRRVVPTIAGALIVPGILFVWLALERSLGDFYLSYISSSLAYINGSPMPSTFLLATPEVGPVFDFGLAMAIAGGIALALRPADVSPRSRYAYAIALFVLGMSVYTVYSPNRGSLNYLQYAIVPVAAAAAAGVAVLLEVLRGRRFAPWLVPAFVVLTIACAPIASLWQTYGYLGSVPDLYYADDKLVDILLQRTHPGEKIAIWGWRPQYYVVTDTLMGTRDSVTAGQEWEAFNPNLAYYRHRYMLDIEKNLPEIFFDAGPDSFDPAGGTHGHEDFPELAAFIRQRYHLVNRYRTYRLYELNS